VTPTSNVGTYESNCSGATDANYDISYVSGTVTVNQATLTVTANNQTMALGGAVPPLTTTITGYVNGQTLATSGVTGSPACTTTATPTSPGGTYPITCSIGTLAATNYTFAFVSGTLTVGFSQTILCDHNGAIVVTSGQSVLIPPGCTQKGDVTVQSGGSLEAEGAIIKGALSFVSGVTLLVCSTTISGSLTAYSAQDPVFLGNGTSSCGGSNLSGVSLTSNTAGVTVEQAVATGGLTLNSNSGGVTLVNSSLKGAVAVEQNSGGATVDSNSITGSLTVTGNTGTVVDRPNSVTGTTILQ
jgi:hypothetical protein